MQIVKPYARIIDYAPFPLRIEHVSASVEFLVDRGITHEIVRHRLFSFTQSSTRFINYVKTPPQFIYPLPAVECYWCLNGHPLQMAVSLDKSFRHPFLHGEMASTECPYHWLWLHTIRAAEEAYRSLLNEGWRPQEARSVFPNALASKLIMTGNLRNWRHFFLMRTSKEAHPQMRQVTIPLLAEFRRVVPVLFEDIVPESRQADNIAKGR